MVAPDRPDWSLPVTQPVGLTYVYADMTTTTPGVANSQTLVAAPGAGLRLRIWAMTARTYPESPGGLLVSVVGAVSGRTVGWVAPDGRGGADRFAPGAGIELDANEAARLEWRSSLENCSGSVVVLYTTETA